jgi:esterase/lipase superfamily enzyme
LKPPEEFEIPFAARHSVKRAYHKWHSPNLQRDMELLVFGDRGQRLLVFPTRKQRFFEFEDHGMIHSLRHRIDAGEIQVICVDSIDAESLYCFDITPEERLARHLLYERYIIEEVAPFTEDGKQWTALIAHGSSFGAFHAVSMAMRYPHIFHGALAFSGRYDLTLQAGDFHSLFHGFSSDELKAIMPSLAIPDLRDRKILRALRSIPFTLVIGEEDPFYENNVQLADAMAAKKIPHSLKVWCGDVHRFRYWRQMIRIYL